MKKYIPLLAGFGVALLIWIGVIVSAPRLSDDINTARGINVVVSGLEMSQFLAERHKAEHGVWPESTRNHEMKSGIYQNWDFTEQSHNEIFIVTARLEKAYWIFEEQYVGEFMSLDNLGNKTYSHEDFKKKFFTAFLKDAKKVDNKKN